MARRLSSPVLVGRDEELARCRALMDDAANGEGATLLITGEAGIGKSRFASELVAYASMRDWTVLYGACDEFSADARPLAALAEMLPAIEAAIRRDSPAELESPAWAALQRLGESNAATGPQSASVPHLFADLLRRLTAHRPVLVVIDDLHWADESTRTVLTTASRALTESPAVVAACYRANEIGRGHPLRPVLATVHRNARPEVIELQPLDYDGVTGLAAGMGLSDTSNINAVLEQSGGVPFLAEELLAHAGPNVPAGIANVVVARIDALGADASALAEAAALETAVPLPVLELVAGLDGARARSALDALVEAGVFASTAAEVTFRHAIGREAVAERILPGRRLELHERLAKAFEVASPPDIARSARHWNETGDRANTLRTSVQAALQAAAAGAHPEAADLFERALDLWDTVPGAADVAEVTRPSLAKRASISMSLTWQWGRAARTALNQLRRDEPRTATETADLWLSVGWGEMGQPGEETPVTPETAFRNAVEAFDFAFETRRDLSVVYGALGMVDVIGIDELLTYAASRAALAQKATPSHKTQRALADVAAFIDIVLITSPLAATVSELNTTGERRHRIIESQLALGNLAEYLPMAEREVEEIVAEGRYPIGGPGRDSLRARAHEALGHWPESLAGLVHMRQRVGSALEDWHDIAVWGWGRILMRMGEEVEVHAWLDVAEKLITGHSSAKMASALAIAKVELARNAGDVAASRAAIVTGLSTTSRSSVCTAEMGEAVAYAIANEADHRQTPGGIAEALAVIDGWLRRLESCLGSNPMRPATFDLAMFIEQARLERDRLMGADNPDAWAHLAARWEALPRPYHAAYCHFRAGSALLTGGAAAGADGRRTAIQHLTAASSTCERLGATVLAGDIQRLQAAAGIRPARVEAERPARNGEGTGLTARETEVLALLVRGQTNGQIARQLGIETRTASVHVSNIIHKLGAANRVDAAVKAGELGVLKA